MLYWKSEEEAFVLYTFSIIHPSSCKWSNSIKETKIEIWKRKYEITVSGSEALKFYSKSTAEIKSHKNFLSNNSIQVQYWNAIHFLFLAHLITTKKKQWNIFIEFLCAFVILRVEKSCFGKIEVLLKGMIFPSIWHAFLEGEIFWNIFKFPVSWRIIIIEARCGVRFLLYSYHLGCGNSWKRPLSVMLYFSRLKEIKILRNFY